MTSWFSTFRIRLTALLGGLSLLLGLGLAAYVNHVATMRLSEARGEILDGITRAIAGALAVDLREREREVVLLSESPLLMEGSLGRHEVRQTLNRILQTHPYYAWVGVVSSDGIVQASANGLLEGANVQQRSWFANGLQGAFIGDVHEAVLLAKLLPPQAPNEPLRFVDFASPILDEANQVRGVLATHAHWTWVADTILSALPRDSDVQGIEVLVLNAFGEVLYPYQAVGGLEIPLRGMPQDGHALVDWGGSQRYLTSTRQVRTNTVTDLGWRIVVRQPVDSALEPVYDLNRTLLLISILAATLFMLVGHRVAKLFSTPVERLHQAAQRITAGDESTHIHGESSVKEFNELFSSLQAMTSTLVERRQTVEDINTRLEQTVAERTAQLRTANEGLDRLAHTDPLTGLRNRRAADGRLHEEYLRSRRSHSQFSVLMIDVDHFKQVNDRYGHEGGDQVLQQVATCLAHSMRETDFVARFGGEEFIAILPDTDLSGAVQVGEKLRRILNEVEIAPVGHVTASIGVASSVGTESSEELVIRHADQALYRAKRAGRNRVESWPQS
ncbi:MAG TPA: hypothetical protein DCY18_04045 [Thauera sp.]|nr:hypothetical protein [Thauera sp.]HNR60982.1 diguanylate cyclase [Thauera sp.]HNS92742.1 diguanylate cyclase [Thauera sp.]HRJ23353.1 diguanylate cyclase [Thauera sp.]